jgi:hypothetical protein
MLGLPNPLIRWFLLVFPKGVWLAQIGLDRLYILIPYIYWLSIPEKALYLLIFLFPIDIDWCFPGQKEPSFGGQPLASPSGPWHQVCSAWVDSFSCGQCQTWRSMEISGIGGQIWGRKPSQTGEIAICEAMVLVYLPT